MGNVIEDPRLSEPFTVYINAAGNPVQRQIREMAAPEAMLALHWAFDETTRLTNGRVRGQAGPHQCA
jgi:hypothetical protein